MEPKIGDKMKVSPQLTAQPDWVEGEVIDVEKNPFLGLVISIKGRRKESFLRIGHFHQGQARKNILRAKPLLHVLIKCLL